jgi:hypothetical protein
VKVQNEGDGNAELAIGQAIITREPRYNLDLLGKLAHRRTALLTVRDIVCSAALLGVEDASSISASIPAPDPPPTVRGNSFLGMAHAALPASRAAMRSDIHKSTSRSGHATAFAPSLTGLGK